LVAAAPEAYLGAAHVDRFGAGIFVTELQEPTDTELQEPTDFLALLEWQGYDTDGPREGHLGLGYDTALASVDTSAWAPAPIVELRLAQPEASGRVRRRVRCR
jgi:hypothetical protein